MTLHISIIFGSVRENRQGIKGARFIEKELQKRGHTVTFVDPLEYDLPLLKKMYKSYENKEAPEQLEKLSKTFLESDAFIIVSAEYNHLPPPALINLLDHFQREFFFKPSAIASYSGGSFGGVRAATHLRDFLAELGMSSIPSAFTMSKVQDSFSKEGDALNEKYNKRITKFLDELEWYAHALKNARNNDTP